MTETLNTLDPSPGSRNTPKLNPVRLPRESGLHGPRPDRCRAGGSDPVSTVTTRPEERMLTASDIDRAATTITAIAATLSMGRGFVRFNDDLSGGRWSCEERRRDASVVVRMPERFDSGSCRRAVLQGLEEARARIRAQIASDAGTPRARDWQRRLRALEVEPWWGAGTS